MTTRTVFPPAGGATTTANGRSYSCADGAWLDGVPDFDATVLTANGWMYGDAASKAAASKSSAVVSVPFERGIIPSKHLKRFAATSTPVVVIVGDSTTTPADQISATDYLSQQIRRKLVRENPDKTISFYERGIPGASWSSLDAASLTATGLSLSQSPWATDANLTWLSYVQTLNPDLIIIVFGANTGVPATVLASFYSVMTKLDTMNTALSKTVDRIFVTSEWAAQTQGSLQGAGPAIEQQAGVIRGFAHRKGYGIIDKNRFANIIRNGIDPIRSTFIQPQAQTSVSAVLTWTAPVVTHDVMYMGSWLGTVAANIRAGTAFQFTIGSFTDNALEVYQGGTGNFFINVRTTGSLLAISALDTGIAVPASGTIYFEVVAKGNWVQFGYSTTAATQGRFQPVWAGFVERAAGTFAPRMLQSGAGGQTIFLNSYLTSTPTKHYQNITDAQMFGDIPSASGGSISVIGGGGTNHMSGLGQMWLTGMILDHESMAA